MEKTTMLNSREVLKSFMKPEANAKEATGKAKRLLDDEDAPGLTLYVPTVGTPKQLASQAATMLFGTTGSPQLDYKAGNSQLLMDYRAALIKAFELGNDIKELYGIVPPNVLFDPPFEDSTHRNPRGYPLVNLKLCVANNVNKQDQY